MHDSRCFYAEQPYIPNDPSDPCHVCGLIAQVQRETLDDAVAAVEALWASAQYRANWITKAEVIAAIKGVSHD